MFGQTPVFPLPSEAAQEAKSQVKPLGNFGERRHPWLSFGASLTMLDVAPDRWDRVEGERWRVDSPEGGTRNPNAIVTRDGRVASTVARIP